MEKTTKQWRATYKQPRIELCAAEPYSFFAVSFNGGHIDGDYNGGGDGGGAGTGDDDGEIVGAKRNEPFFEYLWDEFEF